MPAPTPHRTPLRRDAPHGLGFLEPALAELADEAEALRGNVEGLRALSTSLETFNEAFSSWLYVMNMNALTVDWPEAPTEASFILAQRRAEEDARAAPPATTQPQIVAGAKSDETTTLGGNTTSADESLAPDSSRSAIGKVKKKGKAKLTPKERKERKIAIDQIITLLPLEFRETNTSLRRNVETVIERLMDSEGRGLKLIEMIVPPDLNQARVNKCLIMLVSRKFVTKDNSTGVVLYYWQGLP
ncbi:DASH complex subunit Dam1-domain-containing protein [Lactarius deliciosus]|nr:DASH complex subunit Dam1-domain-containing protein [Lactarius deliciosus]